MPDFENRCKKDDRADSNLWNWHSVIEDSVLFLAVLEPDGNQLVHTLATSDASVIPEDHFRPDSKNARVCSHADFASSGAYRAPDGLAKA